MSKRPALFHAAGVTLLAAVLGVCGAVQAETGSKATNR